MIVAREIERLRFRASAAEAELWGQHHRFSPEQVSRLHGDLRVVLELDRDSIDVAVLARIDSMLEDRARDEWERAAERRMGA